MRTPRNEGVKLVKGGTVLSIYQSREYERPVGWNHLYVVCRKQPGLSSLAWNFFAPPPPPSLRRLELDLRQGSCLAEPADLCMAGIGWQRLAKAGKGWQRVR